MTQERAQWRSRIGFILAAAGSAVGLGNLWKFPYITGENGGGVFVLIYLICIALVGVPIMIAEVLLGRSTQTSPVGAFRKLSVPGSPWMLVGWLGVVTAFVILSYYSVVAGWALNYVWLAVSGTFSTNDPQAIKTVFGEVYQNPTGNLIWHTLFMGATMAILLGGVEHGLERAARLLMPLLFAMLLILFFYGLTLKGFNDAFNFVFAPNVSKLTAAGVLEAMGHSFFTLSLGMGAMLTYGSYLSKHDDILASGVTISILDTLVALLACLVLFPITFTFDMAPEAGPGLVFINIPLALSQLPGSTFLSVVFFLLVVFAALSSAISLLEVASAYAIDELRLGRKQAVLTTGSAIFVLGIPSALSGGSHLFGDGLKGVIGRNWFDMFDYLASNWFLPLGGLGIAVFVAWRVGDQARREGFVEGAGMLRKTYAAWLVLLRYLVPVSILLVFLNAIGVLRLLN